MIVKLLTKHHLECLSFKGGCRGSSEYCWKSHAATQLMNNRKKRRVFPVFLSSIYKLSEYDQELPHSNTADQTTAPRGRTTEH